jgi:DNA mismatch repair protein MutS
MKGGIMNSLNTYKAIKAQYPQHVVLLRIGDFYEAFDDDAHKLAKACDLTVTRTLASQQPVCGFPCHQGDRMIALALKAGHTVAVADVRVER